MINMINQTSEMKQNYILRRNDVEHMTKLSRSTIYCLMKQGKFPSQFSLTGSRSVGWLLSDIEQYIQERADSARINGGE